MSNVENFVNELNEDDFKIILENWCDVEYIDSYLNVRFWYYPRLGITVDEIEEYIFSKLV